MFAENIDTKQVELECREEDADEDTYTPPTASEHSAENEEEKRNNKHRANTIT